MSLSRGKRKQCWHCFKGPSSWGLPYLSHPHLPPSHSHTPPTLCILLTLSHLFLKLHFHSSQHPFLSHAVPATWNDVEAAAFSQGSLHPQFTNKHDYFGQTAMLSRLSLAILTIPEMNISAKCSHLKACSNIFHLE